MTHVEQDQGPFPSIVPWPGFLGTRRHCVAAWKAAVHLGVALVVRLLPVALALGAAGSVTAQPSPIVPLKAPPPGQPPIVDDNCEFNRYWAWLQNPAFDEGDSLVRSWNVSLFSPAGPAPKTLLGTVEHTDLCDTLDTLPAQAGLFTILGGAKKTIAIGQLSHPTTLPGQPHSDLFNVTYEPPGAVFAPALITVTGTHLDEAPPFEWSFENGRRVVGNFSITAGYADGSTTTLAQGRATPGTHYEGVVPPQGDQEATFYRVTFNSDGSAPSGDTTLAFEGTIDDAAGLLGLGSASHLVAGEKEFLAPLLTSEAMDVFGTVDLTQWVGLEGEFEPGGTYFFTDGENPSLPGIRLATEPWSFDSDAGTFVSDSRFTGWATATAIIDGGAIPEPGTMAQMLGVALLLVAQRKERRIAAARGLR
jgi:hypothetical protein